jgi:tetratricopeptide (TPR) repeat protein
MSHSPWKRTWKITPANLILKIVSTSPTSAARASDVSPGRRRIYMLVTVSVPFLLVLALETGLRIGGYGPDLSLFTKETIGGASFLMMNPDVKSRYFARVDFTPNTSYDTFPVSRAGGTFRIFCLGGSTTVGFPYGYCGSFSSFLRDRLQTLFPERNIEVVNLGMTATNSFTVLDIARELGPCTPDLIIVYDGHNEFYGALGSMSAESVGQSRWLTLLYLRIIHSRTFLLARTLYTRFADTPETGHDAPARGTMMERLAYNRFVPYGSPVYARTLETFRRNLEDLVAYCSEHAVPLFLSTQVSNLRHQRPFVSGPPAAGDDTTLAGTWYARGQSADSLREPAVARAAYTRARDLDQLRFRTATDFNDVIRSFDGHGPVSVVDIESVFAGASPDGIVGRELILEHLHPNSRGYALMAKAYAGAMRRRGLLASHPEWARRDTLDETMLAARSTLTIIDRMAAARRTELLTAGWPFTRGASPRTARADRTPLDGIVDKLVGGRWSWEAAHVAAAQYFGSTGDTAAMIHEYRALINQIPRNVSAWLILAQVYLQGRRYDEAIPLLEHSITIEPGFFAHRWLGGLAMQRGSADSAIVHLEKARVLAIGEQDRSETGYLLAVAYRRTGRIADARAAVQHVLSLTPGFAPARELLNRMNKEQQ